MPKALVRFPPAWRHHDHICLLALHRGARQPWICASLCLASRAGDGLLWGVLILSLPWLGGPQGSRVAAVMAVMGVLHVVLVRWLKQRVARPRPFECCEGVRACAPQLDRHSFPSGHTLHAVAFSTVLTAQDPLWGWLLWPFSAAVALSRMVLGLHFPSDVLAAALLGLLGGGAALAVLRSLGA